MRLRLPPGKLYRRQRISKRSIAIAALTTAGFLLFALSNFAVFKILRGAERVDGISGNDYDKYAKLELVTSAGYYAEIQDRSGNTSTMRYEMVQVGGKLVTVVIGSRYFDAFESLANGVGQPVTITGTVVQLPERQWQMGADWFEAQVSGEDASGAPLNGYTLNDFSQYALVADYVSGVHVSYAIVMTMLGLAAFVAAFLMVWNGWFRRKALEIQIESKRHPAPRTAPVRGAPIEIMPHTPPDSERVPVSNESGSPSEQDPDAPSDIDYIYPKNPVTIRDRAEFRHKLYKLYGAPDTGTLNWFGYEIRVVPEEDT